MTIKDPKTYIRSKSTKSQEIAEAELKLEKEESFEDKFPEQFNKFKTLFSDEKAQRFPDERECDHAIELIDGWTPINHKVYTLPPEEEKALKVWVDENLKLGYIRPSKSPIASSFFFVKKKDGSLRPTIDYRKLNDMTVKNKYPLPRIPELLDKIKNAKYFSVLDVRWGYMNIHIKEGHQWKAAFKTKFGLFEPTVMLFGLTNSPATFQVFMDEIYHEIVSDGNATIYMDDIMLFTQTMKEHWALIYKVLDIARKHDLYFKLKKCKIAQTTVKYLGLIITEGHIGMDPEKGKSHIGMALSKRDKRGTILFRIWKLLS